MDQERSQLPLLAFVTVHRELPNALGVCIRQLLVFVALGEKRELAPLLVHEAGVRQPAEGGGGGRTARALDSMRETKTMAPKMMAFEMMVP